MFTQTLWKNVENFNIKAAPHATYLDGFEILVSLCRRCLQTQGLFMDVDALVKLQSIATNAVSRHSAEANEPSELNIPELAAYHICKSHCATEPKILRLKGKMLPVKATQLSTERELRRCQHQPGSLQLLRRIRIALDDTLHRA
jgi:hypothetical protein